ncbi:uncharacterized protein NECHADRAFT_100136 [Fusarium vanettenii 77-13-4]|uniref:Expressed protein n=1 Tax=Fusarium vanettenii (strain ATCC MYA-4622 / CBS 123669 / FGSC 9596 / NRRL 45880 / 77-13-4) TaxID=660122 RepID=C7YQQ0_FUSV7|nr:uncharacterized protein NECHADRAFT_100136 [Fusarium vanettenii 77-13-4]EEU46509.1 expressed protein [Fusarium vanettenii 77-13-4]
MAKERLSTQQTQAKAKTKAKKDSKKGQPPAEIQKICDLLKAVIDSPEGHRQEKAVMALKEALNAEEEAERHKRRIAASLSSRPSSSYELLKADFKWLRGTAELIKKELDRPGSQPRLHKKISSSFKKTI